MRVANELHDNAHPFHLCDSSCHGRCPFQQEEEGLLHTVDYNQHGLGNNKLASRAESGSTAKRCVFISCIGGISKVEERRMAITFSLIGGR